MQVAKDEETSEKEMSVTAETTAKENGALLRAAGIVGMAATASKLLGLLRETVLAAAFGVGPVMTAFSYASLVPTFCLSLLGGVNGPFHSAITAALSKRTKEEGEALVDRVGAIVTLVFAFLGIFVFANAPKIIDILAPGLTAGSEPQGLLTRGIAVIQLKIMAPCVLLAAIIGIGFGSLSAAQVYALPSLSPSLSSLAVLFAVALHMWRYGTEVSNPNSFMAGGLFLAIGATTGAFLQWLSQVLVQRRERTRSKRTEPKWNWRDWREDEGLVEVLQVMVPASIGSGMLQIATYTDLYFASFLPTAAAALGYANLLVMAPLGILSTSLLVPILPLYARLAQQKNWVQLKERIRQGLIISAAVTVPMTATMIPLSAPIVKSIFQRKSFDAIASRQVAALLVCYVVGASAYLARDVLVRVFYALGDGKTPFYVSISAISVNAVLDWILVRKMGFGAEGLVWATFSVNSISAIALLIILSNRLEGLNLRDYLQPIGILVRGGLLSSLLTSLSFKFLSSTLSLWNSEIFSPRVFWLIETVIVGVSGIIGLCCFFSAIVFFGLPEARDVWYQLKKKVYPKIKIFKKEKPKIVADEA